MDINLSNLHLATEQQVFDAVVAHARKQGCRSFRKMSGEHLLERCAYRGKNNTKCFAGIFISDGQYNPKYEQNSWSALVHKSIAPTTHKELIMSLQNVHDTVPVQYWEVEFSYIAKDYGLQYTPPNIEA